MSFFLKTTVSVALLTAFTSCSKPMATLMDSLGESDSKTIENSQKISGSIEDTSSSQVTAKSTLNKSSSLYCQNAKAELYSTDKKIDSNKKLIKKQLLASVPVDENGKYEFQINTEIVTVVKESSDFSHLMIEISGCNQNLFRLVTGTSGQNLNTKISEVLNVISSYGSLESTDSKDMESMYTASAAVSQPEDIAKEIIKTNSTLSNLSKKFRISRTVLSATLLPGVLSISGPISVSSGTKGSYTADLTLIEGQNKSDFKIIWMLNNTEVAEGYTYEHSFTDSSNSNVISAAIKKDDGSLINYDSARLVINISRSVASTGGSSSTPTDTSSPSVTTTTMPSTPPVTEDAFTGFDLINTLNQKVFKSFSKDEVLWNLKNSELPADYNIRVNTNEKNISYVRSQLLDSSGVKTREDGTNYQRDDKKSPFSVGGESSNGVYSSMLLKKTNYILKVYVTFADGSSQSKSIQINILNDVVSVPTTTTTLPPPVTTTTTLPPVTTTTTRPVVTTTTTLPPPVTTTTTQPVVTTTTTLPPPVTTTTTRPVVTTTTTTMPVVTTPVTQPSNPSSTDGYSFPNIVQKKSNGVITSVVTFNSIGLYLNTPTGSNTEEALVRYKTKGANTWKQGQSLWYDDRLPINFPTTMSQHAQQYRGSLVQVASGTEYDIEVMLYPSGEIIRTSAKTWSDNFPVAKTIYIDSDSNQTIEAFESGTENGYILITNKPNTNPVLDVKGLKDYNIHVKGSYIIIRGLTLKGAGIHGIFLDSQAHDIVIENNDISGWGRVAPDAQSQALNFGMNQDSAVSNGKVGSSLTTRIIIQKNKMHHPRATANNWEQNRQDYDSNEKPAFNADGTPVMNPHPIGPQAVSLTNSSGNNVYRFNDVYSDDLHRFNDAFGGGGTNFSFGGAPGRDSDIYENKITHMWDDGIESEGGNMNVRIWGNYIDRAYKMIAISPVAVGPCYIFRNVTYRGQRSPNAKDLKGTAFIKAQSRPDQKKPNFYYGKGRTYIYHNTNLKGVEDGKPAGLETGITRSSSTLYNMVTRNNIFDVHKSAIEDSSANQTNDPNNLSRNDFNFDLYREGLAIDKLRFELNGIYAAPEFDLAIPYALKDGSKGHDQGALIPGFNDNFMGHGPDMGAQEKGAPLLRFGN